MSSTKRTNRTVFDIAVRLGLQLVSQGFENLIPDVTFISERVAEIMKTGAYWSVKKLDRS